MLMSEAAEMPIQHDSGLRSLVSWTIPRFQLRGCYMFLAFVCGTTCAQFAQAQTYRFVFFGAKSPVLIEAQITAGNWNLTEIRQRYAAGAFKRLDTDHDGQLNAEEAAKIPTLGRFTGNRETLGGRWLEVDNNPQDQTVSEGELFTFLDAALGPPLTVEKLPPRLAQTVRMDTELDLDGDGRITPDEFRDGLGKLQLSDFDDDETLSVAELQPFPIAVIQAQNSAAAAESTAGLPFVAATTEQERLTVVERLLREFGQDNVLNSSAQLGIPERFFKAFDTDRNGTLEAAELVRYLEKSPAQLNLQVSLAPPQIGVGRISAVAPDVKLVEDGHRPLFDLAGVPVTCVARNRSSDIGDQVGLYKTRARTADADENGYLDEAEFQRVGAGMALFQDVDLDSNAQVSFEEVGLFFSLDGLAAQSRLVATVSNEAKVLFNLLDNIPENQPDNRLSQREIRNAAHVLQEYDQDGDGALSTSELSIHYRITFSQPELLEYRPDDGMNANARQGVAREQTSGPLWFRRMDRNLDNDLSWREFLGSKEDFQHIDTDRDGLITLEEAEQAEALRPATPTELTPTAPAAESR